MSTKAVLNDLIEYKLPIGILEGLVSNVPWDIEPEVVLTYGHLSRVFRRFLEKEISADEVQRWADLIECRDGIEYELKEALPGIADIIFELANPEINSEINEELIGGFYRLVQQ